MKFKTLLFCFSLLFSLSINAQDKHAFYIGHSLVSHIPDIVLGLSKTDVEEYSFTEQFIPGSPLHWHWNNPPSGGTDFRMAYNDAQKGLASGNHNVLVMTEGIPFPDWMLYESSIDYSHRFMAYALERNPNIQAYIYETWNCINSGEPEGCGSNDKGDVYSWRSRLDTERYRWEVLADSLTVSFPNAKPVLVIPGGKAMGRISDEIDNGVFPEYQSFKDLYEDDIHLNHAGKYFIGLVHYAMLYRKSPVGKPTKLDGRWGPLWSGETIVSDEVALKMQTIAWQVVCNHLGLSCGMNSETRMTEILSVQNPISGELNLLNNYGNVAVYDLQGKLIYWHKHSKNDVINSTDWPVGLLILKIENQNGFYTQKLVKID